jgi:hypothetical protein
VPPWPPLPMWTSTVSGSWAAGISLKTTSPLVPGMMRSPSPIDHPRLGIDAIWPGERIWVNNMWFYLAGILKPAVLAPDIDSSILVGYPAAEKYLGFDGHPSTIYLRAADSQVRDVDNVLAAQANPENPEQVDISRPSAALTAQAAAKSAFNTLFLGLGAAALLIGAAAGLLPALRAARMSPTQALWSL